MRGYMSVEELEALRIESIRSFALYHEAWCTVCGAAGLALVGGNHADSHVDNANGHGEAKTSTS